MDIAVYLIISAVLLGIGSWLFFVWAAKSGHFRDVEQVKHRLLEIEGVEPDRDNGGEKDERE